MFILLIATSHISIHVTMQCHVIIIPKLINYMFTSIPISTKEVQLIVMFGAFISIFIEARGRGGGLPSIQKSILCYF